MMHRRTLLTTLAALSGDALLNTLAAQTRRPMVVHKERELGDPEPAEAAPQANYRRPRGDKPIPDGRIASGTGNIVAAWFSDPVDRYRHFALGTDYEPASLVVALKDRRTLKFTLPNDSVFEDREPRIVTIDGVDMVIAVRAYLKQGAALALLAPGPDRLEIVAETQPIGMPFRWLNPAGVADFDGDGVLDIALVRTPHIGGVLQVWTARGGSLVQTYEIEDVCNHVIRSTHMKLTAIADFNGDGRADLAIPSQDRRTLRFLSFNRGRINEFARVSLPAPASEDFELARLNDRPAVRVGIGAGRVFVAQP